MLSNTGEPDDTPDASQEPPAKKVKAEEGSTPPASSKGNKANAADETTSDVDSATVYCEYKTYFIGVTFSFAYCNYVEGITLHMHKAILRNYRFYRNGNFCKGTEVSKIVSGATVDTRAV